MFFGPHREQKKVKQCLIPCKQSGPAKDAACLPTLQRWALMHQNQYEGKSQEEKKGTKLIQ
jgi:hypothetical protein